MAGYTEAGQLAACEIHSFTPENESVMTSCEIDMSQWTDLDDIKVFTLDQDHMPLAPAYLCCSTEQAS